MFPNLCVKRLLLEWGERNKLIKPMYMYNIHAWLYSYLSPYFQLTQNMKGVYVAQFITLMLLLAIHIYSTHKKSKLDESLSCSPLLVGTSAFIVFRLDLNYNLSMLRMIEVFCSALTPELISYSLLSLQ